MLGGLHYKSPPDIFCSMMKKKIAKTILVVMLVIGALMLLLLCIPVPRFEEPYSTVLTSSDGHLLGATVASDGQWRFPASGCYSDKYVQCLLSYEDRYFFYHPGVNPVSFVKALRDNIKAGRVVRGGSTITMQVVRMARGNPPRTYGEKLLEVVLALRMELRYSKSEILDLYIAHAPFGGNVVGLDAAAWRYFNSTPDRLTWAEAATLAVLPNSPSLIHLGRGRQQLEQKRDNLLQKLPSCYSREHRRHPLPVPTEQEVELAVMEKIPPQPVPMPLLAYHYLAEMEKTDKGKRIQSDIDYSLQQSVLTVVNTHWQHNKGNRIENAGVIVYDYLDDKIVAYVGNVLDANDAPMVDMVRARRSTGSILKPFLFAAMLDDGSLLPEMVLPDVPVYLSGYTPKNYSGNYQGAVTADRALTASLNTPFVYLLRHYGYQRFCHQLRGMGFTTFDKPAEHYGLSIILGGGEVTLYDLVQAYGAMGRELAASVREDYHDIPGALKTPFSADAIAQTFHVMLDLTRPVSYSGWKNFSSSKRVAWKTGTSFGFRDAWAVGLTDRYVVGVWTGNSSGEGRPGLTGTYVAAPILFDVFSKINDTYTYPSSTDGASLIEVCAVSGYPKSDCCPETKFIKAVTDDIKTGVCPYHHRLFLDETRQYQVSSECYPVDKNNTAVYYILPAVMEWFYKKYTSFYVPPPPVMPGCQNNSNFEIMSFVYPETTAKISIPVGIQGDRQQVVFELAHRNPAKKVYWSLNEKFLGMTQHLHQMLLDLEKGDYWLTCVDEDGNEIRRRINVR